MNINPVNSVSFSGVIPVRVYNNDLRVYDEKTIRSACLKATKILAGPVEPEYYDLAAELETLDDSYSLSEALKGYCKEWRNFETGEIEHDVPSDYFKVIFDRKGNPYITTGKESAQLATIGKALGIEKKKCKESRIHTSKDLLDLKQYYNWYINSIATNKAKKLKNDAQLGISVRSDGKKSLELESIFLMQG